eukprot:495535-Pelagomonas_calceolata.AAC.5
MYPGSAMPLRLVAKWGQSPALPEPPRPGQEPAYPSCAYSTLLAHRGPAPRRSAHTQHAHAPLHQRGRDSWGGACRQA